MYTFEHIKLICITDMMIVRMIMIIIIMKREEHIQDKDNSGLPTKETGKKEEEFRVKKLMTLPRSPLFLLP